MTQYLHNYLFMRLAKVHPTACGANVASNELRHAEGGGGVSASVTMYTLSIHQYGT